jgi:hypothetical protein
VGPLTNPIEIPLSLIELSKFLDMLRPSGRHFLPIKKYPSQMLGRRLPLTNEPSLPSIHLLINILKEIKKRLLFSRFAG